MVNGEASTVNGLSQAAIGRALNLSPAAMTKLKQQGMPVDSVQSAQAWRVARQNVAQRKAVPPALQPVRAAPPAAQRAAAAAPAADRLPPPEYLHDESHDAARTRREIAEANLAEMREAETRGELIRLSAVRTALGTAFATAREALLQLPSRLAPQLAGETDPASIQNLLHAEIHKTLLDLSGTGARLGEAEAVPA